MLTGSSHMRFVLRVVFELFGFPDYGIGANSMRLLLTFTKMRGWNNGSKNRRR
jgi:hypothetical protein